MEQIQKRTLRFVYADYASLDAMLLQKSKSCTLELRHVRSICIEVNKALNNISPPYTSQLFKTNKLRHSQRRPLNLFVPRVNQTTFGLKSVRYEGIILWNSLPEHIKTAENLEIFKCLIKTWEGPTCNCNFCKHVKDDTEFGSFITERNYPQTNQL